jgi:small conductance mechanosensitive channel
MKRMMTSGTSNTPAIKRYVGALKSGDDGHKLFRRVMFLGSACAILISPVVAQETTSKGEEVQVSVPETAEISLAPAKVDVKPVARDEEIRERLQSVLKATAWFVAPEVRVEEGVVFLNGMAKTEELKKWAGDLARNTEGVVAVANRMEVIEASIWDLTPAWSGFSKLWREFIRAMPFLLFGLLILAVSVGVSWLATRRTRVFLRHRVQAKLLRSVIAYGVGVFVLLFGTYIVLRVSGLTQLALTVVGGTGLIGLAVGIAFRDITENFLASIFLSIQRPFETGDLVEISGVTGYVQQLNIRTTILMTLDGNLAQIPNATVYKNNLLNFTTNSNRRENFDVGIGYDDSINEAQEIALKVLTDHPAVLKHPEPLVLAEVLGKATVNLRIYFWIDGCEHSWLKVRSSLIRLVKRAYQTHGISMPDEAREVVFPQGVPVTMLQDTSTVAPVTFPGNRSPVDSTDAELEAVSTKAEAGFSSEAGVIEEQGRQAQTLQEGENLLPGK